jgi:hypothetical protein
MLGVIRRPGGHPAETVGDTVHVGVDADVATALEREDEHQVRRLTAHPGQGQQFLHGAWHPAAELLDQHSTGRLDMAGLVAIEAHRIDQLLDLLHGQRRHGLRRAGASEQPRRGRQRGRILGTGRQSRRDEHLEWVFLLALGDLLDGGQFQAGDRAGERFHHLPDVLCAGPAANDRRA